MSAPCGDSKVSKEEYGADEAPWIVTTLATGQNCSMSHLSPGPCPNCGQAGHWRIDRPSLPHLGGPVFQILHPQEISQIFWVCHIKLIKPCVATENLMLSCVKDQ